MSDRIQASLNVWLQSDVERILRGLVQANIELLRVHRDHDTTCFAAGYVAAINAMAVSFGIEGLPKGIDVQR